MFPEPGIDQSQLTVGEPLAWPVVAQARDAAPAAPSVGATYLRPPTLSELIERREALKQIRGAGYGCGEAKAAGYTCTDCKAAGYSCAEAVSVGFPLAEIRLAYSLGEVHEASSCFAGYTSTCHDEAATATGCWAADVISAAK